MMLTFSRKAFRSWNEEAGGAGAPPPGSNGGGSMQDPIHLDDKDVINRY